MPDYSKWPYGLCECNLACDCERDPGPVVVVVQREPREGLRHGKLRVCTKCKCTFDTIVEFLVQKTDPVGPLYEYDVLGLQRMTMTMMAKERKTDVPRRLRSWSRR